MSDLQFESKGLILTDSPCTVDMDDGKPSRWGLSLVLAGFGGFILWAILAPLDAGVVANATVNVTDNPNNDRCSIDLPPNQDKPSES